MNKKQIIAPLAALAIAGLVFAFVFGRGHHKGYVLARTERIGRDLIATTNSVHLVGIGPVLQLQLAEFLSSPARVEKVRFGDDSVGNGKATCCLFLTNEKSERLAIRLKQEGDPEKFRVLGFWTPFD